MPSYRVTRKAQADLIAIGWFTAKEWGIPQRNTYLKQLDRCFSQLSESPKLGVACDFIALGYRKFPQGSHIIFYKQDQKDLIEIIRVLYESMDIELNIDQFDS